MSVERVGEHYIPSIETVLNINTCRLYIYYGYNHVNKLNMAKNKA